MVPPPLRESWETRQRLGGEGRWSLPASPFVPIAQLGKG